MTYNLISLNIKSNTCKDLRDLERTSLSLSGVLTD